jgi:malate dehydrogenase (oxaloacetate-decarboxylating)(NADP+)
MRTNTTAIGAVMVTATRRIRLICGTFGQYLWHLNYVRQLLGTPKLHAQSARSA